MMEVVYIGVVIVVSVNIFVFCLVKKIIKVEFLFSVVIILFFMKVVEFVIDVFFWNGLN